MIARDLGSGKGIAGLVAYLTQDARSETDARPKTTERVGSVATINSPTTDVRLTVRIMQGLTADAGYLKRRAGISSRGRKLDKPYEHLLLSLEAGECETEPERLRAANEALAAVGLEDHYAIAVLHQDTDHDHIHIAASRVHPVTGLAAKLSRSGLALSRWAERWEERHGGIRFPQRVARNKARESYRQEVEHQLQRVGKGTDDSAALAAAKKRARELHPLPEMQRHRHHGAPARRASWQRRRWRAHFEQERSAPRSDLAKVRATRTTMARNIAAEQITRNDRAARLRGLREEIRAERQRRTEEERSWRERQAEAERQRQVRAVAEERRRPTEAEREAVLQEETARSFMARILCGFQRLIGRRRSRQRSHDVLGLSGYAKPYEVAEVTASLDMSRSADAPGGAESDDQMAHLILGFFDSPSPLDTIRPETSLWPDVGVGRGQGATPSVAGAGLAHDPPRGLTPQERERVHRDHTPTEQACDVPAPQATAAPAKERRPRNSVEAEIEAARARDLPVDQPLRLNAGDGIGEKRPPELSGALPLRRDRGRTR